VATIANVTTRLASGVYQTRWPASGAGTFAASGDLGTDLRAAEFPQKHVEVGGTFTGAPTVIIEVSDDGVTYVPAEDDGGAAISFAAAGVATAFLPNAYVRPRLTAGAGAATVFVIVNSYSPVGRG
jgi:hypothetical protein